MNLVFQMKLGGLGYSKTKNVKTGWSEKGETQKIDKNGKRKGKLNANGENVGKYWPFIEWGLAYFMD